MLEPLVSIIIPLYNSEHFICETLDSIANQSYENWECIIVDDGSTDNSFSVVSKYCTNKKKFQLFKRPSTYNPGGSGARNFGLDMSKGIYIQWFDSDDLMHESMLEQKVNAFEEDTHAVICQTVPFKDSLKNLIGKPTNIISENKFVDLFLGKITYYTPGPIWSKSFLTDVKIRFNENLLNIQEWEFYSKILLLSNVNINYVNKPLIYYRKHSNSIWGKERSVNKIMSEYYGISSIYEMSNGHKSVIVKVYFQKLCNLFVELRKINGSKENINKLRSEIRRTFYTMPFDLKSFVKFIKYHQMNL